MGGPSVYVLLLLVNEERNCLGLLIGQNLGRQGKIKLNAGRKAESERCHGSTAGGRHAEILLIGHDLVVIHRLIEMG